MGNWTLRRTCLNRARSSKLAATWLLLAGYAGIAQAVLSQSTECRSTGVTSVTTTGCSVSEAWGTAVGTSSAGYGVLKGSSIATNNGRFSGVLINSITTTRFIDSLTIDSQGLSGKVGTISVALAPSSVLTSVNGNTSGTNGGYVSFGFEAFSNVDSTGSRRLSELGVEATFSGNNDGVAVPFDQPMTATWSFRFGQPFTIRGTLITFAQAQILGSAQADASNSFYWDGITSVSFDGQAVGYDVTSTSGTDWARSMAPVPEPGSALLLAVGLAAIITRIHRGRCAARSQGLGLGNPGV